MLNYHYSYLVGAGMFVFVWTVCFIVGKRYRVQMEWGTVVAAPLALSSPLFIPQYWTPPSLFDLDIRIKIGIEDVLWSAAVGGIASIVGELILEQKLSEVRRRYRKHHYSPLILTAVVFGVLQLWQPGKTIYNTILSLTFGDLVLAFLRWDLISLMLIGALTFTGLYTSLFLVLLRLYPEFITRYYKISSLMGIYVLGIPLEELMFAASVGAMWSVAYEYVQSYRIISIRPLQFARRII